MNFETLKFTLNKIMGYANTICDSYENKPDTQAYIEWYNSMWNDRCCLEDLLEIIGFSIKHNPLISINENKRTFAVYYENELYNREDIVKLENFCKYVVNLYNDEMR